MVNAGFFLAKIVAVAAGSAALQAGALDFFGHAANYAVSLGVAGMALGWRAGGPGQRQHPILFAIWVLGSNGGMSTGRYSICRRGRSTRSARQLLKPW
jgi:hypothetical protein